MSEDLEKLQQELQTLLDGPGKLPTSQYPALHLKADATLPVGLATAKVELSVGVEDGEVKPKFQVELEGLLSGWLAAATEPANQSKNWTAYRAYSGWSGKGTRTYSPPISRCRGNWSAKR